MAGSRLFGTLAVFGVVVGWVVLAEWMQALSRGSPETGSFNKPLFSTFVMNAAFMYCLPIWALLRYHSLKTTSNSNKLTFEGFFAQWNRRHFAYASVFAFFLTLGSYAWFRSLPITSVSLNTAIINSGCVFVFLFSLLLVKETFTLWKVASVGIALLGVFLTSYFGSGADVRTYAQGNQTTALGVALTIFNTVLLALLDVLYGKLIGEDEDAQVDENILWSGYLGIATLLFQWPLLLLFHFSGLEPFVWPSLPILRTIMLNSVFYVVCETLIYVGIFYTSPLFVSIGLMLTMPVTIVVDKLLYGFVMPLFALLGVFLIAAGYIILNVSEIWAKGVAERNNFEQLPTSPTEETLVDEDLDSDSHIELESKE